MVNKQMSVLVVDDFGSMRTQIREILKQMGFRNVMEARDGEDAILILGKSHVDFIISDWNMPGCSGLDLLRHVREDERHKDLPFLMVTAVGDKKNIIPAVELKVSNYIVKPFTPDNLEMKMRAILKSPEPLWE